MNRPQDRLVSPAPLCLASITLESFSQYINCKRDDEKRENLAIRPEIGFDELETLQRRRKSKNIYLICK